MWWKKTARPQPAQVVMYTRSDCHLCADAWTLLEEMRLKFEFELEAVDVDSQEDLARFYGERVPVIVVNGTERLWGRINRVLLERSLRAECQP